MYRNVSIEKVGMGSLSARSETTHAVGLDALAGFVRLVTKAARRSLIRIAIERELSALDDRSLADIGVNRWAIASVAEKAAGEPRLGGAFSKAMHDTFVTPFRIWRQRAQTARDLHRLSDRELLDIGLSRSDIPAIVAKIGAAQVGGPTDGANLDADVAVRDRARDTARELEKLDDRTLQDVGLVRGDIEWVASTVAQKAVRIANRNQPEGKQPTAA